MDTHTHPRELLTVNEAAARLKIHPATLRTMIREERFPALQLGGRGSPVRIDSAELERWLYEDPQAA